jgi:hypothetical protein
VVILLWKLQVVGTDRGPLFGAQATQEWMDPIQEGKTMADTRRTDSSGFVVFAKRVLHNRLRREFLDSGLPR